MSTKHSFDAIIVDSNLDTRMRLKQACASVHHFGKVFQAQSLKDATGKLGEGTAIDVCFISYLFDQGEVTNFIKDAKGLKSGQDSAYILVLKSKDQQASTVATNVIAGFDGFLFEPYSVEQLVELTALAARVRKERSNEREAAALRFLLNDMMNQIDQIAYLKAAGFDMGPSMKKFKDMCSVLGTLTPDSKTIYETLVVELFGEAPLPKKIFQRKIYGGASSRVKKRQDKEIAAQIAAQVDAEPKS